MDKKDKRIKELEALVASLMERIAELELALAKANKDSSTSSKPPSSDIAKPKPKKRPGRPRKPRQGGQLGHQRQLREPLPPDRVDNTIDYEIDDSEVQRLGLTPTGNFEVIQHIELPETPAIVTEHRLTEYVDAAGYLNFDYFSANCSFAWNYCVKAQYCWAHLIRDIRFLENRFMELIGNAPSTKEAGNLAARFRTVQYTSDECDTPQNYDLSEDYFRFMFTDGVEPTNNHSEQQIRHCVIDRRITQGTRGKAGQRYHERMWTMITAGQSTTRGSQYGSFSCLHSLANPTRSNLE